MSYRIRYSDYVTSEGPPDPAEWVGPPGPVGPVGPKGEKGDTGDAGEIAEVLATGSTTPRSIEDREARVAYVSDYGGSIQAAHDAMPATGGTIMLAANTTYVITVQVLLSKPNVRIAASSWNTIVQRGAGYTSGIVLRSTGAGNVIEGFTIDGNGVAATTQFEVNVVGDNSLVRNMQFVNSRANGNLVLAGNNSRATGNRIIGPDTDPGSEMGYGIWAINHQTVMIDHNTISGTGIDGIGFDGDGSQVIGNRVFGCHCWAGGPGGQIGSYRPPIGSGTGSVISGNTIGPGGSVQANGIEAVMDNGLVSNNVIESVGGYGILVPGNNSTITGNTVHNVGGSLIDGIFVLANVSGCNIVGNKIYDDRAVSIMRNGISIGPGSGDRITIVGNEIIGFTSQPVVDQSTGNTKVIAHNTGQDTQIPVVASAGAVAFFHNPVCSLTGSATITAISAVGQQTGRTVTLIPTGTAQFIGGAGAIANSATCVPGVPIRATFNGTSWYLSSSFTGGTVAGNVSLSSGTLALTHSTANIINFGAAGFALPSNTTRSIGAKLVLYSALTGTNPDFSIGVQSNGIWFAQPAGNIYSWYNGTTSIATLSQAGSLTLNGGLIAGNTIAVWGAPSPPSSKPAVTGSRGGNAALASLLTALASYGLVTDSTSA